MTDFTLPIPATTPVGFNIGGRVVPWSVIWDSAGAEILGVLANPDPKSIAGLLTAIKTALGNPAQAGGAVTISNTPAVTVSGTPNVVDAVAEAKMEAVRALIAAGINVTVTAAPAALAQDSSLQSILTAIVSDRDETVWVTDAGAYYVRVDKNGAITWADPSGNVVAAPDATVKPAAGTNALLAVSSFQATAAGAGYSIGDFINHLVTTNPTSGAAIGNFWLNVTTGAKIAAPASANIAQTNALPTNAATQSTLLAVSQALGALTDAPYTDVTGAAAGSPIALAKALFILMSSGVKSDTVIRSVPSSRSGVLGFTGAVATTSTTAGQFTLTTAPTSGAIVADPVYGSFITIGTTIVNARVTGLVSGTANTAGAVYQTNSANTTSTTSLAASSPGPTKVAAANANRRGLNLQSAYGFMYVDSLRAPAADGLSLTIPTLSSQETPSHHTGTGDVYALGQVAAQPFYGREF